MPTERDFNAEVKAAIGKFNDAMNKAQGAAMNAALVATRPVEPLQATG